MAPECRLCHQPNTRRWLVYWLPNFCASLSPAWPASIGAKCTVSLTPTHAASLEAPVVDSFFFLLQPARRTSAWGPTLHQLLCFCRMVCPCSLAKAGQTHTPRRQSELSTKKLGMFWAGMVGPHQGPAGLSGTEKILGLDKKQRYFWGYFFWPNWKGGSARFCLGGLPRAVSIWAVVPGGRCAGGPVRAQDANVLAGMSASLAALILFWVVL